MSICNMLPKVTILLKVQRLKESLQGLPDSNFSGSRANIEPLMTARESPCRCSSLANSASVSKLSSLTPRQSTGVINPIIGSPKTCTSQHCTSHISKHRLGITQCLISSVINVRVLVRLGVCPNHANHGLLRSHLWLSCSSYVATHAKPCRNHVFLQCPGRSSFWFDNFLSNWLQREPKKRINRAEGGGGTRKGGWIGVGCGSWCCCGQRGSRLSPCPVYLALVVSAERRSGCLWQGTEDLEGAVKSMFSTSMSLIFSKIQWSPIPCLPAGPSGSTSINLTTLYVPGERGWSWV